MRGTWWLIPVFAVAALALLVGVHLSSAKPPRSGKKPKAAKPPPDEDAQVVKALEKWSRPGKTERDRFFKALGKAAGEDPELTAHAEGSDAEYRAWFDRLAGGEGVWREADITRKPLRSLFAGVAGYLQIDTGEITAEQFLRYARQRLAPGQPAGGDDKVLVDGATKLFRKLDRDRDGFLDDAEMSPTLRAEKARWDSDGDGRIDLREFEAYFAARLRDVAEVQGTPLPPGGEAKAAEEEARWRTYRPGQLPSGLPAWFVPLDRDRDGQVGLYEWKAAGRDVEEFLRLDANGDGFITAEEALRAQRRSRGGPPTFRPS